MIVPSRKQLRTTFTSWDVEKVHAVGREAHFQVKMYKTHQLRITFGSWDVEKVHAVVARSTFPSQNVQSTPAPDHFWKLRCRKSARRCGAKHISKSKCTKHTSSGPLLEVEMWKKCTPLWREAHFEVKMYKTLGVGPLLEVQIASRGRRKGLCTLSKVSKTWGFCSIFNYNHHYITLLHYITLHSTSLHYITLRYTTLLPLKCTTLHSTTLQLQVHSTTLHYTPLH